MILLEVCILTFKKYLSGQTFTYNSFILYFCISTLILHRWWQSDNINVKRKNICILILLGLILYKNWTNIYRKYFQWTKNISLIFALHWKYWQWSNEIFLINTVQYWQTLQSFNNHFVWDITSTDNIAKFSFATITYVQHNPSSFSKYAQTAW